MANPTPYNINPITRGINGFGLQAPNDVWGVTFGASTEATVTVPSTLPMGQIGNIGQYNPIGNASQGPNAHNKWIAIFDYGVETPADIFVSLNQTAVVPAGDSFAAQSSVLMPKAWNVNSGDVIHAITATVGGEMTVSFYAINE